MPFWARPAVGTALAILSGLSFLFLCMLLPLVGPSGAAAPHAAMNFYAFLGVLLLCFGLAVLAVYSKLKRRRIDASPLPFNSLALCLLCLVLLVALLSGLLKI